MFVQLLHIVGEGLTGRLTGRLGHPACASLVFLQCFRQRCHWSEVLMVKAFDTPRTAFELSSIGGYLKAWDTTNWFSAEN